MIKTFGLTTYLRFYKVVIVDVTKELKRLNSQYLITRNDLGPHDPPLLEVVEENGQFSLITFKDRRLCYGPYETLYEVEKSLCLVNTGFGWIIERRKWHPNIINSEFVKEAIQSYQSLNLTN